MRFVLKYFSGVCEFHEAFVSIPKGDLDSSDSIDGPDELVIMNSMNYPYGTTEMFPEMRDSKQRIVPQSAHEYAECSNAGICNRKTGICDCFEGFEGAGCQRMKCPKGIDGNDCSGHGICQSLNRIARKNFESKYGLWSKDIIQGCICDAGFYGFDCSFRTCKHGLDPLYIDDVGTIQIPSYFLAVMSTSSSFDLVNGFSQAGTGYYRLRVFDKDGQGWYTQPIQARSTCGQIVKALEDLPHNVIPAGQTVCYYTNFSEVSALQEANFRISYDALYKRYFGGTKTYTLSSRPAVQEFGYTASALNFSDSDTLVTGDLYLLQFFGNIGDFQQPEINIYTEYGSRPSLVSLHGSLVVRTWTNGQQGMSIDYFTDRCEDMQVQVIESRNQWFFWGTSFTDESIRKCIAYANHDPSDDEIFRGAIEWDPGSLTNPHAVRLVRTVADDRDGGFFVLFYFDRTVKDFDAGRGARGSPNYDGAFRLLHPFESPDGNPNVLFTMFATNSTVLMAGNQSEAVFDFGSNIIYTTNVTSDLYGTDYDGDVSCEAKGIPTDTPSDQSQCLDKEDYFFLADPYYTPNNPRYINMYKAKSIRRVNDKGLDTIAEDYAHFNISISPSRLNMTSRYRKNIITTDLHTNWAQDASSSAIFHIYKFIPDEDTSYRYVSECSNRGLCNPFEGICECFFGYTGDNCAIQNTIVS